MNIIYYDYEFPNYYTKTFLPRYKAVCLVQKLIYKTKTKKLFNKLLTKKY